MFPAQHLMCLSSSGSLSRVCCLVHSAGWRPVGRGWAAAGPRHSPHQDRRRLRAGRPHRYRAPGQDQRQCPCRHEEHWAPDPDGEDHAGLQSVRVQCGAAGRVRAGGSVRVLGLKGSRITTVASYQFNELPSGFVTRVYFLFTADINIGIL